MFIRLFILSVLLCPPYNISYGEDKTSSSEEKFQQAMLLLKDSIDGLSLMANGLHALTIPSRQLLGLLSTDVNKAILFLEDVNSRELTPREISSQISIFSFINQRNILNVLLGGVGRKIASFKSDEDKYGKDKYDEYDVFFGEMFLKKVDQLTNSLNSLEILAEQGYGSAKQMKENFEEQVENLLKDSKSVVYQPSIGQSVECEITFTKLFHSNEE